MKRQRITWVDTLRGFCMLAILLFHTEVYYAGKDIIPYSLYVDNVLAVFLFLSGYVLYRQETVRLRKMLYSIYRWLVVPYFVLTSLMAIPKTVAHHNFDGIMQLLTNIFTGHASWFISALIVAKLLLVVVLCLSRSSTVVLASTAIVSLLLSAIVGNANSPYHYDADLWNVNEAMLAYSLMVGGFLFHKYQSVLASVLFTRWGFTALTAMALLSKYAILLTESQCVFGPLIVSSYPLFLFDIVISILLYSGVFMKLSSNAYLEWVGQRSIAYYFFCGGCPLLVGFCFEQIGFHYDCYVKMAVAYILVVTLSTVLVWLTYRYTQIFRNITNSPPTPTAACRK